MPSRRSRHFAQCLLLGTPLVLAGCAGDSLPKTFLGAVPAAESEAPPPTVRPLAPAPQLSEADFLKLAARMRSDGDPAAAARFYRQAADANPQDVSTLIALGDMLSASGDAIGAAEAYGKAITLQPGAGGVESLMGMGRSRIAMDQPEVASTQFEAVLKQNDKDVRAYNGLGVAADLMGDHEAAQEQYRAGLAIDPENKALLNNLGLSLALGGDTDNAGFMLEELAAAPDASAVTRQNLALAYGLAGRDDDAERVARVDLDPAAVRQNLAFIADHRGATGGKDLANALKVDLTGVQFATGPAIVPPAQVAEVHNQAVIGAQTAALAAAEPTAGAAPSQTSMPDVPAMTAAPTTPVLAQPIQVAALPPSPMPEAAKSADAVVAGRSTATVVPTTPAEALETTTVARAAPVSPTGFAVPTALPAPKDAVAAVSETPPPATVASTADAPASTLAATTRGERPLIAVPVAAFMAKAPASPIDGGSHATPTPTTVSFFEATSPAEFCRDAGLGAVNCMANLAASRGRPQSAMAFTAAFHTALD
jgi:Flp pilus assembly protein TadD